MICRHLVWFVQWGFIQRHGYKLCGNFSVTWMKLKSIWKRTDNQRFAASSIGLQVLHPLLVRLHEWSCWWQRFQAIAAKSCINNRYPRILSCVFAILTSVKIDKVGDLWYPLCKVSRWHIQIWIFFPPTSRCARFMDARNASSVIAGMTTLLHILDSSPQAIYWSWESQQSPLGPIDGKLQLLIFVENFGSVIQVIYIYIY